MLYEIHMIKNYPPVNLNRDDTGSPKTCYFGGVQRGRISSQCLKRSWRISPLYDELLGSKGIRTRKLGDLLRAELERRGCEPDFIEEAVKIALKFGKSDDSRKKEEDKSSDKGKESTKQTFLYSPDDIKAIADKMVEMYKKIGSVKAFSKLKSSEIESSFDDVQTRGITLDIALFGRMVTSKAFKAVEASMQVAHAISTHAVNQESDYFTAVDDLLENSDETGAGMIGDIDYNSCCFYHYAAIDTDILFQNLETVPDRDSIMKELLPAIIQIMAFTNPSGKQNTFAGHILPSLICVEVKHRKIPVSYANAYAKPVNSRSRDLVGESCRKLTGEIDKLDKAYAIPSERLWFCTEEESSPERAVVCDSLEQLCEKCKAVM